MIKNRGVIYIEILIIIIVFLIAYIVANTYPSNKKFKKIDKMNGFDFETYMAKHFKRKGYKVINTPKTGDYGADLILTKRMKKSVVQIKRYNGKVGVKAIQEVIAAKSYYNAKNAYVVSNSFFTNSAITLAKKTNVKLIDRKKLQKII